MIEKEILSEVNQLPENLQLEVLNFIMRLRKGYTEDDKDMIIPDRIFGRAKGMFRISPDFDDPLKDFEEYM
ncbi:DUF2281 domain-containing protein [Dyadobacter sp. CY356]|uniref:type II toxin-antitoxin system VapB family antitoxin n=1 Tax=Dyadobacter sp. CY356 TaxID=2906442 RepID=UPI001F2B5029|nr:DUF2281 domain-containing protein [Dyadobacter sp. CY356]MCF0055837.1 DUF2281 domain-containing protein [Dyadobacter sp. CY356]